MNIYPGPPHDEDGFFWRSDCKDDVEVIYVVDYGFWYPWYYSFPYYYGYGDCGIDEMVPSPQKTALGLGQS